MRGIIGLIIVVGILALLGWITFGNNNNQATINVEKEKIRQDVDGLTEAGENIGKRIEQQVDKITEEDNSDSQP